MVPFRSVTVTEQLTLRVSDDDFVDWNRRALAADLDLSEWISATVRRRLSLPPAQLPVGDPSGDRRYPVERDGGYYEVCQYCGDPLPLGSTRRRQYCDDWCRVPAWRLRKRESAAATPP